MTRRLKVRIVRPVDQDATLIFIIRYDTYPDTHGMPARTTSFVMDAMGNWQAFRDFDIIEPTIVVPGYQAVAQFRFPEWLQDADIEESNEVVEYASGS